MRTQTDPALEQESNNLEDTRFLEVFCVWLDDEDEAHTGDGSIMNKMKVV